jgi:ribonuclease P protein component
MAPRTALGRLRREEDFRRIYRDGTRHATPLLVLHTLPNQFQAVRLGFAVGRRFGRAVIRNRLRRRLREAARASCEPITGGVDLVVVPRTPARAATVADLRVALGAVLSAAGLLPGERRGGGP